MQELLWAIYQYFVSPVLWLLQMVVIVYVVMSWLIAFGVVSAYNPTTRQIVRFLESVLGPILRPIRRIIPPIGGLDLSVFVLILLIGFLQGYGLPKLISLVPF
ncbi:MAG: YggT family protein [Hyphomonadaceae bacterium]